MTPPESKKGKGENPVREAALDAASSLNRLAESLRVQARKAARATAEEIREDAKKAEEDATRAGRYLATRAKKLADAVSEWAEKKPSATRDRVRRAWRKMTSRERGSDYPAPLPPRRSSSR